MSNKYEDLIKNARMNAGCGEHMSPAEVTTLLNVVETTLSALAAENAGMSAFVDALLSIAWQGGSADGAEIQELAFKHGLLRQEVYSADEHENQVDDPGNFEDGDPVYFRVDKTASDAFLAEVRASGMPDESTDRNLFEEWVMENVCISKSTLEGLRTDGGYRNSTLSGRDYNVMWLQWKAVRAGQLRKGVQS